MFGFLNGYKRELCLYCFEHFRLGDTPFRCDKPAQRCRWEVDPVTEKHWGEHQPIGRVVPATGRYAKSVRCDECNGKTKARLCPHCHSILPMFTGRVKNYVFSIIGAKESGKSHFLPVLIEQLEAMERQLNMCITSMTDPIRPGLDSLKRYKQDFYNPVYKSGMTIDATRSALVDSSLQRPLLFNMTFTRKGFFGGESLQRVSLAFFDTAGEDLNDRDIMSAVNKYIIWSDGIILLMDPLQLDEVRTQLDPNTPLPGVNTEAEDILTRTHDLIMLGRDLDPDDKVPVPIAVTFSKFDAVQPLVSHIYQLNADPQHGEGFDELDFVRSNNEIEHLLENKWGGAHLSHQVKMHFEKYGFFGVSALGCNPHATNRIPVVKPKRVEDPFLWLLRQSGLIESTRSP